MKFCSWRKCHKTYKARQLINGHVIVIAYELIVIEMNAFLNGDRMALVVNSTHTVSFCYDIVQYYMF